MLVDWLVYGLIIWGLATVLNKTAFKAQPASKVAAWGLTFLVFFMSVAALSAAKVIRYQVISDSFGVPISPKNPLDIVGAFVFAWLFYTFLNRAKGEKHSAPVAVSVAPVHSQATYESVVPVVADFSKTVFPENHSSIPSQTVIDEDRVYAEIANELEGGVTDKGLWTRLFAECGGDEKQTKVQYIKQRAERLIASERIRLELAVRETARATAKAEIDRLVSAYVSGNKPTADDIARLSQVSSTEPSVLTLSDNMRGDTLLHWCARLGLDKEATILITNGADPNTPNGNGQRPFELAEELALRAVLSSASKAQQVILPDAAR